MSEPDLLFPVRNHFYLGAYQSAINEAADLDSLQVAEQIEREYFVYRSYVALGQTALVESEVTNDSSMALQAVKLLAEYLSGATSVEQTLASVTDWMQDPSCSSNPLVQVICGMIYAHEGNFVEALKCCYMGTTLEMMALCVQVYLQMARPDQAEKQVKKMSDIDDDATLSQLASAWTNLSLGGKKVQDAMYIYQELGDKYNWTPMLHNGLAICYMKMCQYEDAEKELLEALNKDAKDVDTLANLVVCALHLGKPATRYQNQLKTASPSHPSVKLMNSAQEMFERAAAAVS
eukprot:TRINITY_DN3088_c0_g1_i3.p1 TRINITY_DN3088_c0_g1~~TRINITY_DN3088_c0_g1_i3.p1  ORF type:complete len:332 (-),score=32.03 TRINITY_DN3088_c0_g1_i3:235-1107(-)